MIRKLVFVFLAFLAAMLLSPWAEDSASSARGSQVAVVSK